MSCGVWQVAIVDGEWFTGGSANLVDLSMEKDHTELNISVWDKPAARRFLADLVHEHSGGTPHRLSTRVTRRAHRIACVVLCVGRCGRSVDTSGMTDVEMVATLQRVAKANGQALRASAFSPHQTTRGAWVVQRTDSSPPFRARVQGNL